ncbi:unnamed protein product [Tenebrio molitor]|nr:unnamed protein product [Tenebrio molitor]
MGDCIRTINYQAQQILSSSTYIVDIIINKVYNLESQLAQCRGDILCISPLVTEISLSKIRLPQNIKTEVQAAESILTTLRLSTQGCSDDRVSHGKLLTPRDLADEAEKQLDELQSIVQGEILVAHDDLQSLETAFTTYSDNILKNGAIEIQQESEAVDGQLTTIKDLAHSAGKDVSYCTDIREEVLERLPENYIAAMGDCIRTINYQAQQILSSSKYIVDIIINKVYSLQSQLTQCWGDILCISPLVTEISLSKIRLPQNIKTEVQAAESTLTTLRLSSQGCSDDRVAEYTSEANSILRDITACVDRIIG